MWNIAAEDNQYVNIVFREPFEVQCDEQCSLDYVKITKGPVTPEPQGNVNGRKRKKRQIEQQFGCGQSQYNFAALGIANREIIPLDDNVIGRYV